MKQRFGHRSAKWPTNDCCHGWHSPSCTSRYLRCETPVFVLFVEMLLDFVIMLRGETPFLQLPVRDEEDGLLSIYVGSVIETFLKRKAKLAKLFGVD